MKIKPEHYEHIRDAMFATLARFGVDNLARYREELAADPRVRDLDMRLRWDVLHASVGSRWICDEIYPYANDTHLDTALRRVMQEAL